MSSHPNPYPQTTSARCVQCGHDLTGATLGGTCPQCGAPVNAAYQRTISPACGHAVASMVLGIISIPACFFYGLPGLICGILAIYFCKVARLRIQTENLSPNSESMAKAGQICGIIGTCLSAAMLLLMVVYIIFFVAMVSGGY